MRKRKREKGEEYFGKKKVDGKWTYNIKREKKKIQPPCNCKLSLKYPTLKCRSFSELERINIFTRFWSKMTWAEKKVYISLLMNFKDVNRPRNRINETSRRSQSLVYYMKRGEERVRVCKQMFLNTHSMKEKMILDWLRKNKDENRINDDTKTKENHS